MAGKDKKDWGTLLAEFEKTRLADELNAEDIRASLCSSPEGEPFILVEADPEALNGKPVNECPVPVYCTGEKLQLVK